MENFHLKITKQWKKKRFASRHRYQNLEKRTIQERSVFLLLINAMLPPHIGRYQQRNKGLPFHQFHPSWALACQFPAQSTARMTKINIWFHYFYNRRNGRKVQEQTSFMSWAMFFNVSKPSPITSKPWSWKRCQIDIKLELFQLMISKHKYCLNCIINYTTI